MLPLGLTQCAVQGLCMLMTLSYLQFPIIPEEWSQDSSAATRNNMNNGKMIAITYVFFFFFLSSNLRGSWKWHGTRGKNKAAWWRHGRKSKNSRDAGEQPIFKVCHHTAFQTAAGVSNMHHVLIFHALNIYSSAAPTLSTSEFEAWLPQISTWHALEMKGEMCDEIERPRSSYLDPPIVLFGDIPALQPSAS